ncbi:MAG: hypothetical protein AAF830_12615 [Pseudomonadota bacterium]
MIRGIVIALVLIAFALVAGVVAGGVLCGEGTCAVPLRFAEALGIDGEPFTITGTAMEYGVVLLALGLIITMLPREPAVPLAALFVLLIGADGFLMTLKPAETPQPAIETEAPARAEPDPVVRPAPQVQRDEPAPRVQPSLSRDETLPEPCPEGAFFDGQECAPCTVEMTSEEPAQLQFEPIDTDAYWVYASHDRVSWRGANVPVTYLVEQLDEQGMLCDAPAVLVFGSASSDGDRDRNKRRAARRADGLAAAVARVCGNGVKTFALSLGQSRNATDVEEDRPVSIVQVFPREDAEPTGSLILEELGYELAEGDAAVPLLSRRDRFPEPWVDEDGSAADLKLEARPQVTEVVEALGAPAMCGVPTEEGANLFETSLPEWTDDPEEDADHSDLPTVEAEELAEPEPTPEPRQGPGRKGVDDPLFLSDTPRSRR